MVTGLAFGTWRVLSGVIQALGFRSVDRQVAVKSRLELMARILTACKRHSLVLVLGRC